MKKLLLFLTICVSLLSCETDGNDYTGGKEDTDLKIGQMCADSALYNDRLNTKHNRDSMLYYLGRETSFAYMVKSIQKDLVAERRFK